MLFQFTPAIQAAIDAGRYVQVLTSAGVPIGMVRDPLTGKFVAHAIGAVVKNSSLSPLVAASQLVTGWAQMVQTHIGFQETYTRVDGGFKQTYRRLDLIQGGLQSLQTNVGVLQATTSVIGVGVAAGVPLSAVNLYQTMKLKQAVERLEIKVDNGFINLEQALKDHAAEIQ